jgi:DNA invertase Pin-like site-specific DNA recombinase
VPRAYSYTRFSTPEQELGDSQRRQLDAAREYARREGLDLDEGLQDRGVSAFRGKNAKAGALGRFLEEIDAGAVTPGSVLLVENIDRLSRQGAWDTVVRIISRIVDAGVSVVTLVPERVYSLEALRTDRMLMIELMLIAQRANEESSMKADRLRKAWGDKRRTAASKKLTAVGPSWLRMNPETRSFEPIPERVAVVRRIFDEALTGKGTYAIAEGLNRDNVPVFGRGQYWHRSFVVKILHSPAVVGTLVPHTLDYADGRRVRNAQEPVPQYYPAAVSEDAFQRVQAMRMGGKAKAAADGTSEWRGARNPRRGAHATAPVQNIFGGLARCGRCGGSMVRINKGTPAQGRAWHYLVCSKARTGAGCRYTAVPYATVELAFLEQLGDVLGDAPVKDDGGEIDRELAEVAFLLENAAEVYADTRQALRRGPSISASQTLRDVERERDQLLARQRELREVREATASPLLTRRLEELEEALTAEEIDRGAANVLMRQVFSAVEIDPDAMQLQAVYKQGGRSPIVTYGFPAVLG